MMHRPITLSALMLSAMCLPARTTLGQSTVAVEAGANRAPDYVAAPAGYMRYRSLRPDVVDYYLTERRRDWGYELDFDYDRLRYDERGSAYSLYDTYYNNYEVKPAAPGVVDPLRDATVLTPGEAIDVEPDGDAVMPRPAAVSPRSPIPPRERAVVVDDDQAVPDGNLIDDDDLYDEPNDEVLYGYDEVDDNDNWVYDYYTLPNNGDAVRPPQYYEQFGVVSDLEGDGPFDGFQAPEKRNRDNKQQSADNQRAQQQQQQQQDGNKVPMTTVSGTVTMVKNVPIQGADISHRVIQVENSDGKQYTVDLGNTQTFNNLPLQAGTDVTVDGNLTTIGKQQVLVAKELNAAGENIVIQRSRRVVRGNIVQTRMLDYEGGQIVLATVDTQAGTAMVDMGLAGILDKVALKPGSPVTASGREVQINSQNILLAETVIQGQNEAKTLRPNIEANRDVKPAGNAVSQNSSKGSGGNESSEEKPRRKLTIASTIDENGQKRTLALPPETEGEANARRQETDGQAQSQQMKSNSNAAAQAQARTNETQQSEENPDSAQAADKRSQVPMVRMEGTVERVAEQKFGERSRQLAIVTTKGGNTVRLDLGPIDSLELKLQKGDQIRAEGALTQLESDEPLILAERVTKGDKSYTAQRYRSDMETVEVTGQVTAVNAEQVLGEEHHILTLQTADQQKVIVDAGPSEGEPLQVEAGTELIVDGVMLKLKQGNLLVADNVRMNK